MKKVRILLVEDEPIIVMDIESKLMNLGYDVISIVDSGIKAIELSKREKPDLILMDISIKGEIDGIATAEIIRSQFNIPIIFMTAFLDEKRLEKAKLTMPFGYILKPVQERDLRVTIKMALHVSAIDSERRKEKQKLKESEQNYRSFIEKSPIAIIVVKDDMTVTYANQKAILKSEYSKDEIVRLSIVDLIAPFDIEEAISKWSRREGNTNPEKTFEISVITKSKKIIVANIFFIDIVWEGEPAYLYFLNDVTSRRKTEQALKESEQEFRTVVENMNEGLTINNHNFELVYINKIICETLGYSEEDLIGFDLTRLCTKKSINTLFEHREKVKQGGVSSCEVEVIKRDGTLQNALLSTTPILENGKFSKSIAIFTDITDLKKNERLLEQTVEERTKELIIAKENAEQANRLKSEFLANISHELRTPMHSILSFSRFGYENFDRKEDEKLIRFFKNIFISGDRLMNLLNDLLDLSILQAGKMVYNKDYWGIRSVFDDIKTEFAILAKEKHLSWHIQNVEKIDIAFDIGKISQVVSNLFSNAIKYSNENSVIKVSFEDANEMFITTVKNDGISIPTDELESIFDPFVQSSTTKTGAGGTGLGLPICKKIIEDHGGKIWAEDNPNGATIKFFLKKEPMVAAQ